MRGDVFVFTFFNSFNPIIMTDNDTNAPVDANTNETIDEGTTAVVENTNTEEPAVAPQETEESNETTEVSKEKISESIPQIKQTRKEKAFNSSLEKLVKDGEIDESAFSEYHEKNPKGAASFIKQFNRKNDTAYEVQDFVTVEEVTNDDVEWLKNYRQEVTQQSIESQREKAEERLDTLIKDSNITKWDEYSADFTAEAQVFLDAGFSYGEAVEKAWLTSVAPKVVNQTDSRKEGREQTTLSPKGKAETKGFDVNRVLNTREEYIKLFGNLEDPAAQALRKKYDAARKAKGEPSFKGGVPMG